ncbi:hypothetical protein SDC9_100437 [bioreactor metagenome]|uniref:Uncharacterized protein n=1 Tax=bioreactor metagenome TaxID=1076179 RepID=A0A645ALR0_9ZZZZ
MAVSGYAECFKPLNKNVGSCLSRILRDDYTADKKAKPPKGVDEAKNVGVVRDAEVTAELAFHNIRCVDSDDNFSFIAHCFQEANFTVRFKTRQHPRCVIVVEEFSAELKVELVVETADALKNVFRLLF